MVVIMEYYEKLLPKVNQIMRKSFIHLMKYVLVYHVLLVSVIHVPMYVIVLRGSWGRGSLMNLVPRGWQRAH